MEKIENIYKETLDSLRSDSFSISWFIFLLLFNLLQENNRKGEIRKMNEEIKKMKSYLLKAFSC